MTELITTPMKIALHHTVPIPRKQPPPAVSQRGIALYIVIILVLLSTLLALWASRTSIFNQMIIGNDADYQRAYEAAEAMIQDATVDINDNISETLYAVDYQSFMRGLGSATLKCKKGACEKRTGPQDFWNDTGTTGAMAKMTATNVAARYGDNTNVTSSLSNTILLKRGAKEGAWYWIEVIPYVSGSLKGLGETPYIYRITAIAKGLKPSTQVVLQSVLTKEPTSGEASL